MWSHVGQNRRSPLDTSSESRDKGELECERHAAARCGLFFALIFSPVDRQHTHIDLHGERCSRHRPYKTEMIRGARGIRYTGFTHSCCLSIYAFFSLWREKKKKLKTISPLLPLSFCKHSTALLHIIFQFLIMHNTKDNPKLTSTNATVWVFPTKD